PDDTIARFDLVATASSETMRATFVAYLPKRYHPPLTGLWIDTTSFNPAGGRWIRPGEEFRLSLRASEGSQVRVILPGGRVIPLMPDRGASDVAWGELAFGTTTSASQIQTRPERYVGRWSGPLGPDPGTVMAPLNVLPTD